VTADVRDPRIGGGLLLSVLLHGGAIAAFILLRPSVPPATPPMIRLNLIAAPAAEPAAAPTPAAPPAQPKEIVPPKAVQRVPPKTPPKVKAPTTSKTQTPPPAPLPGVTPARGTDVANLVTAGIDFPYPGYINTITNAILRQFANIHEGRAPLRAEVSFIIRRDGSVAPESIRLGVSSGVYPFDQDAIAAVEAAAKAHAWGPLPPGFREDILPVRFRFDPASIR
jgi:outer membrane biosynthesis protein TonB